ncbi:hypothetical protein BWO76_05545 (plasmid) [Sinorhizobium meliloti]|nr:hypothetical protein BWO76_05545 [Sinorhizobium meliloti]
MRNVPYVIGALKLAFPAVASRLSDEATDPEGGTTGIHRAIIGWWRLENMALEPLFKPTD